MMKKTWKLASALWLSVAPLSALAMEGMHPVISTYSLDRLERSYTQDGDFTRWEGSIVAARDLEALRLNSEGHWQAGSVEESEHSLLYERAVSPYWNLAAGVHYEDLEGEDRYWLEWGLNGLAPYFFDTDVTFLLGEQGRSGIRLDVEKELMLTQKWVVIAQGEADLYGRTDEENLRGSGLSKVKASLQLGYQLRRDFMPYVGVQRADTFGATRSLRQDAGQDGDETVWVIGVSAWY